MRRTVSLLFIGMALVFELRAQPAGLTGQWVDPNGAVIRIDRCGERICMWVAALSSKAPSKMDIYNPDPAKRTQPICGLQIGSAFVMHAPNDARDGTLYDPKTGKTYHGNIKLDGNRLQLRGYIGIPLFGESQTWTRPTAPVTGCAAGGERK